MIHLEFFTIRSFQISGRNCTASFIRKKEISEILMKPRLLVKLR